MSARQLIVLVVAAIAAVGALLLIRNMGARDKTPAADANAIVGAQVLVAARDIGQGAALTPSDLAVRIFPQESVTSNFIQLSSNPSAQADYVNAVTRRAFVAGEPIVMGSVIQPDGHGFMAAQLQPGFRAVALEIESSRAAGGFIGANDRVDVILTQKVDVRDGSGSSQQVKTDTIIEDVRVLALDDIVQPQTSGEAPERHAAEVATLELSAADARVLEQAKEMGEVSLALRGVQADTVGLNSRSRGSLSETGTVRIHAFGTVSGGGR